MSAADIIRKQHQREALACLEDGGQPLISPPSEVVIDTTLVDLGMGVSPPRRRGRRDSDRFKTMSMVSSLGFGTTSPGFTGTNVTTWDFGQWQYGCYDNFNVVNQRASQAFASPGISSPKPEMDSRPGDLNRNRNSYFARQSYHEPSYRHRRASTYDGHSRPKSFMPPVPPLAPQRSYSAHRPSYMSPSERTTSTDNTDSTDSTERKRSFHAVLAMLAELLPSSRWIEKKLKFKDR